MIRPARHDWRTFLLLVGGGGIGLLAVGIALAVAAYATLYSWTGGQTTSPTTQVGMTVVSGALGFVGAILIAAGYQALIAVLGKPNQAIANTPMRFRSAAILLLVWLAASILAQAVTRAGGPAGLASPLQVVAVFSPVYLLARLATAGLAGGTRLRMWGTLAAGAVCGTGISALVEIALLVAGASAAAMLLAINPEHLLAVDRLLHELSQAPGIENALAVLQPILVHPISLAVALLTVSVVIPIVEEVAKSAAPWFIYRRLSTGAEGFVCGAVSGASFALVEGLMASVDPSGNWTVILLTRGGSSTMHILASALAGWGIASFRVTRRASMLAAGYVLAIGIHALWNAAVVGIGYGGLRSAFSQAGPDVIAMTAVIAGGSTLLVLVVLLPAAILVFNRILRLSVDSREGRQLAGHALAPNSPHLKA